MIEIVGGDLDEISFHLLSPSELTPQQNQAVNALVRLSVGYDYPDRHPAEIDTFVRATSHQRLASGGQKVVSQRENLSHANEYSVYATINDEVVAYLSTADAASGGVKERYLRFLPKGLAETIREDGVARREFKLTDPSQVIHRWHNFSMRAVDPEIMARDGWGTEAMSLLDIMGYLALGDKDAQQPVSTYPWSGEHLWKATVLSWGLQPTGDRPIPVYPFGENMSRVMQSRMTATSVELVQDNISAKDDAKRIISISLGRVDRS